MAEQSIAQILGRKGERWFRSILPDEWIFNKPEEDFGIDGTVIIGEKARVGALEFHVQIKSTSNCKRIKDFIVVPNISRGSVLFWIARLAPTMLVLYDRKRNLGYYGWIPEILPSDKLRTFLGSKKETISLKIPKKSIINEHCWHSLNEKLRTQRDALISLVFRLNISSSLLNAIHSLSVSLRLLMFSLFDSRLDAKEHRMMTDLSEMIAYKNVIRALSVFRSEIESEIGKNSQLSDFLLNVSDAVRSEIDTFTIGFDVLLETDNKPVAVRINPEKRERARPRLWAMLTEIILTISGIRVNNKLNE